MYFYIIKKSKQEQKIISGRNKISEPTGSKLIFKIQREQLSPYNTLNLPLSANDACHHNNIIAVFIDYI